PAPAGYAEFSYRELVAAVRPNRDVVGAVLAPGIARALSAALRPAAIYAGERRNSVAASVDQALRSGQCRCCGDRGDPRGEEAVTEFRSGGHRERDRSADQFAWPAQPYRSQWCRQDYVLQHALGRAIAKRGPRLLRGARY